MFKRLQFLLRLGGKLQIDMNMSGRDENSFKYLNDNFVT